MTGALGQVSGLGIVYVDYIHGHCTWGTASLDTLCRLTGFTLSVQFELYAIMEWNIADHFVSFCCCGDVCDADTIFYFTPNPPA